MIRRKINHICTVRTIVSRCMSNVHSYSEEDIDILSRFKSVFYFYFFEKQAFRLSSLNT